mmetsp:Transcript_40780/g.95275  ORF Transcript_40780/g.95275 Transcript_40780/m.95275 type:complete len:191 (+) Transcript_40780:215-787(+)
MKLRISREQQSKGDLLLRFHNVLEDMQSKLSVEQDAKRGLLLEMSCLLSAQSEAEDDHAAQIAHLQRRLRETTDRADVAEERVVQLERRLRELNGEEDVLSNMSLAGLETLHSCLTKATDRVQHAKNVKLEALASKQQGVNLCCVCQAEPKRVIFMPCRHLCACARCAARLVDCPICRSHVAERIEIYDT